MNTACHMLNRGSRQRVQRSEVPVFMRLAEAWAARDAGRVHTEGERQWLLCDGVLRPIKIVLGAQP